MKKAPPVHAPMDLFPVVDDCLQVAGRPLTEVASEIGHSPFYVYDRQLITDRVRLLREQLPSDLSLHYAIKANPMPSVVQHLSTLVDGLDVASAGELRVALDTGVDPIEVSFAGPGKMDWELERTISAGAVLNLESPTEMERAARIGERLGKQPHVAVRVNPSFQLKNSGMQMGGGPKAFGTDAERVPQMLERLGELGLDFRGFHIYWGSQNLKAESVMEAQNKAIDLAFELAEHAPRSPRVLNIGGGFGIPLFPGDGVLDLGPIADNLGPRIEEVAQRLDGAETVIELGRYLVGEAGLYVCQVVDRKDSRGETFIVTNGGLHHHLAASGNFGQVIRKNYPVVIGNKVRGSARETANIVGPLCTPLDVLGARMEVAVSEPGDLVVVHQSGAYGFTVSPHAFLGHPPPVEVLV